MRNKNDYIKVKDENIKKFGISVWAENEEVYEFLDKLPESHLGVYIIKKIFDYKGAKIKRLVITKEKDEEKFFHDEKSKTLYISLQTFLKFMYQGFISGKKSPFKLAGFAYENGIAL